MNQTTVQAKSYKKRCKNCQQEVIMDMVGGKWKCFELDRVNFHKCKLPTPQPQFTAPVIAENLNPQPIDAAFVKGFIAAIHELSYTINTQVISSLATTQEERDNVLKRIHKHESVTVTGMVT